MPAVPEERQLLNSRISAAAGLLAFFGLFWLMTTWVGAGAHAVTTDAFITLFSSLPIPLAWLAGAFGIGWPAQRLLARSATSPLTVQLSIGIAVMLLVDASLGAVGVLSSQIVAWAIVGLGIASLIVQAVTTGALRSRIVLPPAIGLTATPALAVLFIASCSAPGWLWSSEFGGYDALSYHLQLPREWLANGQIEPAHHNVYSFLPGYVEAAYLHLMSMRGNALTALYDCQVLHALLCVCTSMVVGRLVANMLGRFVGVVSAVIYLATPWTIVVGSLAYNEMAVNLMLAAGMLVVFDERQSTVQRGTTIGLLCAAACGAKLTSLGFVVAPIFVAMLMTTSRRHWPLACATAAMTCSIGVAPWLLRNAAHAGNPVFPFLTEMLGTAHWTSEQAETWHRGHTIEAPLGTRLLALWRQLFTYGFGPNPTPGEPWLPQWGLLPWLGVFGLLISVLRARVQQHVVVWTAVLLMQVTFWLTFTHLQSRFLLPCAVPLTALAAIGVNSMQRRQSAEHDESHSSSTWVSNILKVVLLALSLVPVWIYSQEGRSAPALAVGTALQQAGDGLPDHAARMDLGSSTLPAVAVNWLLPERSQVLLVGESAPLYYRMDRITYTTVWDRGPLSIVLREAHGDPDAICELLRARGFTHVLVNPTMLAVWERSGWNDPLITRTGIVEIFERAGEPLFDYPVPSEVTIYGLPE